MIGWHFCLLRQRRLQITVTYVRVSSLICSRASLSCSLFQRLQIVDFVNALTTRCEWYFFVREQRGVEGPGVNEAPVERQSRPRPSREARIESPMLHHNTTRCEWSDH